MWKYDLLMSAIVMVSAMIFFFACIALSEWRAQNEIRRHESPAKQRHQPEKGLQRLKAERQVSGESPRAERHDDWPSESTPDGFRLPSPPAVTMSLA